MTADHGKHAEGVVTPLAAQTVPLWRKRGELVALALVWLALGTLGAALFSMVCSQTGSE